MQKKFIFFTMIASLIANFAFTQSAHDDFSKKDTDYAENVSRFMIKSPQGGFVMGFKGHMQMDNQYRYDYQQKEGEFNSWLRRVRFKVYGNAFVPELTYFFQTQFDTQEDRMGRTNILTGEEDWLGHGKKPGNEIGTNRLRDYYVNMSMANGDFQLRLGKFRTPFSRQQLISTSQMQFNDQDRATNEFQTTSNGRDIGIMVHNGFRKKLEYAFALTANGPVGRIGFNYGGIDGYEMADFVKGPFRMALAANGFLYTDWNNFKNLQRDMRAGIDFITKFKGFSTNGHFYYKRSKATVDAEANNYLGSGIEFGYLFGQSIQPVARYSIMYANENYLHEITGGINFFRYGHHLKAQVYGGTTLANKKIGDILGGVQFQFAL